MKPKQETPIHIAFKPFRSADEENIASNQGFVRGTYYIQENGVTKYGWLSAESVEHRWQRNIFKWWNAFKPEFYIKICQE